MKKILSCVTIFFALSLATIGLQANTLQRAIAICQAPSESQLHTLMILFRAAKMQYSSENCSALYQKMSKYKKLNISNLQIEDISPLIGITHFTTLGLSNNLIKDIKTLNYFSDLIELNLSHNSEIEDYSSLNNLYKLERLYLDNNNIDNLVLVGLNNLKTLNLYNNQIHGLTFITEFSQLMTLGLSNNQIVDIKPLKSLHNLTELNLADNKVVDIGSLSVLKKLSILNLYKNPIKDISPLKNLINLSKVNISSTLVETVCPLKGLFYKLEIEVDSTPIFDNSKEYKKNCVSDLPPSAFH